LRGRMDVAIAGGKIVELRRLLSEPARETGRNA
jgi:hypothetical protein